MSSGTTITNTYSEIESVLVRFDVSMYVNHVCLKSYQHAKQYSNKSEQGHAEADAHTQAKTHTRTYTNTHTHLYIQRAESCMPSACF